MDGCSGEYLFGLIQNDLCSILTCLYSHLSHHLQVESWVNNHSSAFTQILVDYMFSGCCEIERHRTPEAGLYMFRAENLIEFYGAEKADALAHTLTVAMFQRGVRCKKTGSSFARSCIIDAVRECRNTGSGLIYKKRKRHARVEHVFLQSFLFGNFGSEGCENVYWS